MCRITICKICRGLGEHQTSAREKVIMRYDDRQMRRNQQTQHYIEDMKQNNFSRFSSAKHRSYRGYRNALLEWGIYCIIVKGSPSAVASRQGDECN